MKNESHMMSYGYNPEWSEGSVKPPIFQTSTFVFKNAEEGKRFFEIAYGKSELNQHEQIGLIYSRLNNPNMQILEERLAMLENSETAAAFESGMSAISTTILAYLKPPSYSTYDIEGLHLNETMVDLLNLEQCTSPSQNLNFFYH